MSMYWSSLLALSSIMMTASAPSLKAWMHLLRNEHPPLAMSTTLCLSSSLLMALLHPWDGSDITRPTLDSCDTKDDPNSWAGLSRNVYRRLSGSTISKKMSSFRYLVDSEVSADT
uniref:Putative secreted protein n=1 Tax=Ixodes ricinus TaxID=34613 RepID=A0A6B0UL50_IXORI